MRNLKFRAWDNTEQKWYKPVHEAYKGRLHTLMLGFGGDLLAHVADGIEHESTWFPNKYAVNQYTGLKDKNGKEIYEGDIIDAPFSQWKAAIVFSNARFELDGPKFINQTNFQEHPEVYKVIGNIYENKDLIK